MTQIRAGGLEVEALSEQMRGTVLVAGAPGYEQARTIWNGDIDHHPAVIARCLSSADVAAAISWGRECGLELSIRGGGHGYSGSAVAEAGLMIDLSEINQVLVDPDTRRVRCGGGCHWAEVDAATQRHELAVPGGMISHTGIGGLTLGGGMGWLHRRHGLSIDNLVSAEVVLADGRTVRASLQEHPELFWALRGGGGNFGVVTEFEYQAHPVGPQVHLGLFFWPLAQATQALRLGRDTVDTLPDQVAGFMAALNAPPAPFVPEQHHHTPGVSIMIVGYGSAPEHAAAIAPVRATLPPLFELVTPIAYVELQQMLDDLFPWGCLAYTKGLTFDQLSDEIIEVLVEHLPAKKSAMTALPMFMLGGAYARVGEDDTAFGGRRSARCMLVMDAIATDPDTLAAERAWVRNLWEALRPMAADSGSYVNAIYEDEHDRVRATYGPAKYERLTRIKTTYDPDNIFHLNANIKPH